MGKYHRIHLASDLIQNISKWNVSAEFWWESIKHCDQCIILFIIDFCMFCCDDKYNNANVN